jgi:UrcA family protein
MFARTIALSALASLSLAGTVHAADVRPSNPDMVRISVPVGDLDMSSSSGAAILLSRVHSAAVSICGDAPDIREAARFGAYQSCVNAAVDQTVASLDNPVVTAMNGHQPHPIKVADRR